MKKNSRQQQAKDQQLETERKCMQGSDEIGGVAEAGIGDKRSYLHLGGIEGEMLEEAKIRQPRQASRKPRPEIALLLNYAPPEWSSEPFHPTVDNRPDPMHMMRRFRSHQVENGAHLPADEGIIVGVGENARDEGEQD